MCSCRILLIVTGFMDNMYDLISRTCYVALLRLAALRNIPTACNRATADFLVSSPLIGDKYEPMPDLERSAAKRNFR
jgi:methylglyoxal synthase